MNQITKSKVIAAIVIAWLILMVLAFNSQAGYELGPECHPGQHICSTDSECEDEEAFLLDQDELHQSDDEIEGLKALDNTLTTKGESK